MHLRVRLWLLWAVSLLSACRFNPALPADAIIECQADTECPSGRRCAPTIHNCVSENGDKDGATLLSSQVTPALATRGAVIELNLVTSEPLFVAPSLSLENTSLRTSTDDTEFTFAHTVSADDTEGEHKITATTFDLVGNLSVVTVGTVTFDFTAPQVLADSIRIQPTLARPGESLLVQVAFSELLGPPPTVSLAGGAAVMPTRIAGALATFQVPVTRQTPNGMVEVTINRFTDRAGNEAPASTLGSVRVDAVAPRVTTLEVVNGYSARSAQPGFNTFTIIAEGDAGPTDALASIEVRFLGQPLTCRGPSPTRRECDVTVTQQTPVGDAPIQVVVSDTAGNTAIANARMTIDLSAPVVAEGSLQQALAPGPGSLAAQVSRLGEGAQATVTFSLNEPAVEPFTISLAGQPLTCTHVGTRYTCNYLHHCSQLVDGTAVLQASWSDALGNAFAGPLPGAQQVTTDCLAPLPPAVTSAGKVVWHRAPYGAGWSSGVVGLQLELAVGAVAENELTVRLGSPLPGHQLALLTTATVNASTASVVPVFDRVDRSTIAVQTVDGAGNASPVVTVQDNVATVALTGAQTTSLAPGLFQHDVRDEALHGEFSTRWSTATTSGLALNIWRTDAPLRRTGHQQAPLPNGQVLLMGGTNGTTEYPDVWVFDTNTHLWREQTGPKPVARTGHVMAPLPLGRVLLVGGQRLGVPLADSWVYTAATERWEQVPGPQPAGRFDSQLVTLPNGKALLLGGLVPQIALRDAWLFDLKTLRWTQLTTGVPPGRVRHRMAALGDSQVLLFGGDTGTGTTLLGDSWVFDSDALTFTQLSGTLPGARADHSLTTLSNGDVLLVGGVSAGLALDDSWVCSASTHQWARVTGVQPPLRVRHQVAALGSRQALLFGGTALPSSVLATDTWVFDGVTGQWSQVSGGGPPGRQGHVMTTVPGEGALLLGGVSDSWLFSETSRTWSQLSSVEPSLRSAQTLVGLPGGKQLLYGGNEPITTNSSRPMSDSWVYDPATSRWSALSVTGESPGARSGFYVYTLPDQRILFHLYEGTAGVSWLFDPVTNSWARLTGPQPPARELAGSSPMPNGRFLLIGGRTVTTTSAYVSDAWVFDSATLTWSAMPAPLPTPITSGIQSYRLLSDNRVLGNGSTGSVTVGTRTTLVGETWALSAANSAWSKLPSAPTAGRYRQAFTALPNGGALVFGGITYWRDDLSGFGSFDELNDTWSFDGATNTWSQLPATPFGPVPQVYAQLYPVGADRALLLGRDGAWVLDPTTKQWLPVISAQVAATAGPTVQYDPAKFVMVLSGQTWRYDLYGGAVTAVGFVPLQSLNVESAQVTGLQARAQAGADGSTRTDSGPQNGVELQLYRTSASGPLFQSCAGAYAPSTSVRNLACGVQPFAGGTHVALRLKPYGFSNARNTAMTVNSAELDVHYRSAP